MTGPWVNEPNHVDFEESGLKCAMRRGPSMHWCGYVGVPSDHPWFGLTYNSIVKPPQELLDRPRPIQSFGVIDLLCSALRNNLAGTTSADGIEISLALEVHGGITWSDDCVPGEKPDGNYWFGFDCAHAGDLCPKWPPLASFGDTPPVYRDQNYVVAEVQNLAQQLALVAKHFRKMEASRAD